MTTVHFVPMSLHASVPTHRTTGCYISLALLRRYHRPNNSSPCMIAIMPLLRRYRRRRQTTVYVCHYYVDIATYKEKSRICIIGSITSKLEDRAIHDTSLSLQRWNCVVLLRKFACHVLGFLSDFQNPLVLSIWMP